MITVMLFAVNPVKCHSDTQVQEPSGYAGYVTCKNHHLTDKDLEMTGNSHIKWKSQMAVNRSRSSHFTSKLRLPVEKQ